MSRYDTSVVPLWSIVVLLAAVLACSESGDRPAVPYVLENVCPFECCTYGTWTARERIPVYERPADGDGEMDAHLEKGQSFEATRGQVITREAGRVSVHKPDTLIKMYDDSAGEYRSWEDRLVTPVPPGDTIFVLSPLGEGIWTVWYEGETYRENGMSWRFGRRPETRSRDEVRATFEKKPTTEWWVRVRTDEIGTGWVLREGVRVEGADACS